MGRKKKKPAKPWCWYCNREFDDEKILIQHQKAKHFKCHICHKKLYTGPGLAIHCMQVHKESIDKIPNALPNRNSVDVEVYGMEGIPEGDVREHERNKLDAKPNLPAAPLPNLIPGLVQPGIIQPTPQFLIPHIGMPFPPTLAVGAAAAATPSLPNATSHVSLPTHPPPPLNCPPLINVPKPTLPLPTKPLFPSVSPTINPSGNSTTNSINKSQEIKTTHVISSPNSKIMHPVEDISLEEHRARLPKYSQPIQHIIPTLHNSNLINTAFTKNSLTESNNNDNISQPLYSTPNGPPPKPASFQSTFRPAY